MHNFHRGRMVVRAGRGTTLQAGCVGWEVGTRTSSSPKLSRRGCSGRGTLRLGQPNLSCRGFGSKFMLNVQISSDSLRNCSSYVRTCILVSLGKKLNLLKICSIYLFFSLITLIIDSKCRAKRAMLCKSAFLPMKLQHLITI